MPDVICVPNNNKSDTCAYHTIQSSRFSYYLFHYSMFQALFNREGFFWWIFFCFLILFLYFHHHSRWCCFREHAIVHQYTKSSFYAIRMVFFMPSSSNKRNDVISELTLLLILLFIRVHITSFSTNPSYVSPFCLSIFSIVFVEQKGKIWFTKHQNSHAMYRYCDTYCIFFGGE